MLTEAVSAFPVESVQDTDRGPLASMALKTFQDRGGASVEGDGPTGIRDQPSAERPEGASNRVGRTDDRPDWERRRYFFDVSGC
jgi:hypothetical protein